MHMTRFRKSNNHRQKYHVYVHKRKAKQYNNGNSNAIFAHHSEDYNTEARAVFFNQVHPLLPVILFQNRTVRARRPTPNTPLPQLLDISCQYHSSFNLVSGCRNSKFYFLTSISFRHCSVENIKTNKCNNLMH